MKVVSPLLALSLVALLTRSWGAVEFKEAEITTLKNEVQHDAGTGSAPAKMNEKIGQNSKLTTAAASMAELTFADSSITRLGANSLFSFQSKERLIKLDQGSILVNTPPGKGGATVDCGGVTGAVSGTTFMASRDSSGNVMFVMLEGSGVLKVTVSTPAGTVSKEIRPGQAATVGSAAAKVAADSGSTPGGGTDTKAPASSADSGEAGDKPTAKTAAPSIQVFDVDVKKIVESAPLIREFKTELPSMEKIEVTIEKQQTAVKEGKLERLEVEVVALKEDGDLLIGAPRVNSEDIKVVNRKEAPDAGLDIDTAAGGEPQNSPKGASPSGGGATAGLNKPPPPPSGNLAGLTATEAADAPEQPPTAMTLKVEADTVTVKLNRTVRRDRVVDFTGFSGLPDFVVVPAGSDSVSLKLDSEELFPGVTAAADPSPRNLSIKAVSGNLAASASLADLFPIDRMQAANPIRDIPAESPRTFFSWMSEPTAEAFELELDGGKKIFLTANSYEADGNFGGAKLRRLGTTFSLPVENLPGSPGGSGMAEVEMMALDNYFFFTRSAAGVSGEPSVFYANSPALRTLDPGNQGPSVDLGFAGQNYALYAAKRWEAGAAPQIQPDGQQEKIFYGDRVDLHSASAFWNDLSPWNGTTAPVLASDIRWDTFLGLIADPPSPATLVWDDQNGIIDGGVGIGFAGLRKLSLAAGSGGISMVGVDLSATEGSLGLATSGDLEIKTSRISGIGAPATSPGMTSPGTSTHSSGELTLEAAGTIKLGAQTVAGVAPTQTKAKDQQVRLEAMETAAGAPTMAVIRTGDSLELRNVTIRSFAGTKLEKVTQNADGSTTLNGRVLMSGSAVKDFKIKELVGAAVNADAKIQMMAMDGGGNLAGEMMVEGQMPVATKLAGAMASLGPNDAPGNTPVHADVVDLAARTVNFNNATITAMNSITARANTVIVQNSFMTVVRSSGMINMYVREGAVNMGFGTVRDGYANFAGANTFRFGNVAFNISNQDELNKAYGTRLFDAGNGGGTQPGAINVLKL